MKIEFFDGAFKEAQADAQLELVLNKDLSKFTDVDFGFCGYDGTGVLALPESRRVFVGVKDLYNNEIRNGVAKGLRAMRSWNIKSVKMRSYNYKCVKSFFANIYEGAILGLYKFDKYKSDKKPFTLEKIVVAREEFLPLDDIDCLADYEFKQGLGYLKGSVAANAANFARDIVNEIPQIFTPEKFAEVAQKVATESNGKITCEVWDEAKLKAEKMEAFLAVARASTHAPRLIHLTYKPANAAQKIVFVGKGLCYDSGGLSLKPSDYMVTMKADKSGAAAALAIIKAVSELGDETPFEVHAILGCAENMIGGNAYKPDDVLVSRSGVTIEVRNTDAEGRLVLADCLDYAQDLKPDLLVDMATLTGACVVGLGEYTSAIMGWNEDLKAKFKKATSKSGELYTVLEFNEHLGELIKSQVADVSNCASSRYGGALTAGLFLDKFIRPEFKDKWLHLDIAGPAYVEKAWGIYDAGATGAGVLGCLYYLMKVGLEHMKK